MIISLVLIENGSALNFCPMLTLSRIGINDSLIQSNGMMVRAFDGAKTSAYGEINLKVLVGPYEFEIPSVLVDIPASSTDCWDIHGYTQSEPFGANGQKGCDSEPQLQTCLE